MAVDGLPAAYDAVWALELPEPRREQLLGMSTGAQELVALVQTDRALCDHLEAVRSATTTEGFVHGDVRWDNCLALVGPSGRRRTRVLLVDWESAGTGPVAADPGAVLAEYLAAWVESVPIVDRRDPGRLLARASRPMRRMQPAMREFWAAYRDASRSPPSLRYVVELAAVRLLQTAVERAQELASPTAHVVAHAQLAANLLRRPADAARPLLCLREP
jgi:aminoglycoside phosphotransferase (APT) family kinase protein